MNASQMSGMTQKELHHWDLCEAAFIELGDVPKMDLGGVFQFVLFANTSSPAQLFPNYSWIRPTSMVGQEEQKRRRQLRLYTFFVNAKLQWLRPALQQRNMGRHSLQQPPEMAIGDLLQENKLLRDKAIKYYQQHLALEEIRGATQESFKYVFTNKQISFKTGAKKGIVQQASGMFQEVYEGGVAAFGGLTSVLQGKKTEQEIPTIGETIGSKLHVKAVEDVLEPVLTALNIDFKTGLELAMDMCPNLAAFLAKEAALTVPGFAHVAITPELAGAGYQFYVKYKEARDHRARADILWLADGTNQVAYLALTKFVEEELYLSREKFVFSGVSAAALGGDAALPSLGTFLNLALKLVKNTVDLVRFIYAVLDEYRIIKEGNEVLAKKSFTPKELFEKAPILCCYYLALAPHSALIATQVTKSALSEKRLKPGGEEDFQRKIHEQIQSVLPLIEKAKQLLNESRIEIPGIVIVVEDKTWWTWFNQYRNGGKKFTTG